MTQVLSQWATEAAGQGHLVPRIADLEAISAARTVEAPGMGREAVQPWLPTIQWLLKQAAFGVVDPHIQLPDELSRPVGPARALQVVPPYENSADAPAPPVMEVSLVAVVSPDTEQRKQPRGDDKFRDLTTEYMVKQDFADYGVRIDKQLLAFIEVKRVSQKLNERHLRQVQMYAVRAVEAPRANGAGCAAGRHPVRLGAGHHPQGNQAEYRDHRTTAGPPAIVRSRPRRTSSAILLGVSAGSRVNSALWCSRLRGILRLGMSEESM